VALGRILQGADVGKANGGHLVLAPQVVNILVHPRIQHILVLVIAPAERNTKTCQLNSFRESLKCRTNIELDSQVEDKVGGDQHEVGKLVALARVSQAGQLVGEASQSRSRHQDLNLLQLAVQIKVKVASVKTVDQLD